MTPPPAPDPRRDSDSSTEIKFTGVEAQDLMRTLSKLTEGMSELRDGQKAAAITMAKLEKSDDSHRSSLVTLTEKVQIVEKELAAVKVIATRADEGQMSAHRKVSEARDIMTDTLMGVQKSQDLVANKAESVAAKTNEIVSETKTQTVTLGVIHAANVQQNAQLEAQTTQLQLASNMITSLKTWLLPALIVAGALGSVLGKFVESFLQAIHH